MCVNKKATTLCGGVDGAEQNLKTAETLFDSLKGLLKQKGPQSYVVPSEGRLSEYARRMAAMRAKLFHQESGVCFECFFFYRCWFFIG
jgi:hypothetical protein